MQSLLEEYNKIYQKIKKLNERILEYQNEIKEITSRRDEEIPARIENLNNQLKKIDEYQLKIDGFIQLAEKHMTSKNVLTIEAPPGYRVNINRLRTWAMMIDPMAEDDPYAQRVYLVAKCDKLFLDTKKEEFTKKVEELTKDYEIGAPEELKRLEKCIEDTKKEIRDYLSSEEISDFGENVRKENDSKIYLETPGKFVSAEKTPEFWIPGAYGTVLDIDPADRRTLKGSLGNYYDEKTSKVYLPIERIRSDEEFAMLINCVPARKRLNEMDAGIRNILFQMIDKAPAGSRKIYVIDAIRQNSALIGTLKDIEGTFALQSVPRTQEQMQTALEEIVSSFSDIDDVLENYDTVTEFNSAMPKEKQIPRTIVVLVGWSKSFVDVNKEYVNRIISNYERYGVSFIAVNISAKKEKDRERDNGISDYVGENLIQINMDSKQTNICFGTESEHAFSWYPFKHVLQKEYCDAVRKIEVKRNGLGTEYIKRVDLEELPAYTRGKKNIELPYGVDSKDQMHSLSFENESFAAYLMGASGSGKSTLLHTLITGIVRNYHPDDVELWLADFKMSEFSQYIDPMPPHVKYILLDESRELVYDLIDKLTEKMMERQRFFMKNRELKKVENVPPETHMPIIFVMLDEFSIMSQAINESQDYRIKLQNLLAKGRALGIKFLFSSQTFTSGIAGLTLTAKAQIQLRIAMKGSRDEIAETLELAPSQKTEQVQGWVDALPPHYALVKYRVEDQLFVRRVQVMYFKGTAENAYQKQKELIERVNSRMHSVENYNPSAIDTYLYKNPVVVDGNSYEKFDKEYVKNCINKTIEERAKDGLSDEIFVAFGNPRLMTNIKLAAITPETRENILLLAPMSEQPYASSVVLSVIQSFKLQGKDVDIWAYGRNRMYVSYKELLKNQGKIIEGTEAVSLAVKEVKDMVVNRDTKDKLVVILGIERITGDFEFIEGKENAGVAKSTNPKALAVDEEAELKANFAMAWGAIWEKREPELKKEGLSEEKIKQIQHDEKFAYYDKEWKEKHEQIKARKAEEKKNEGTAQTEEQPKAEKEQPVAGYNAMEDLQYILMQGSRQGIHFMVCLNNYADIKLSKCKVDWFRHRLSFQLAPDESRDIFRTKIASELPEHICQYYDTLEGYSFRPYLHRGIDWEGWGIDENGEVISPYM